MIEDFLGRTHEIILKPGDILFFESAKIAHGRPNKFVGSWFLSLFLHYVPPNWEKTSYTQESVLPFLLAGLIILPILISIQA
jgi:hypothetical protein